MKISKIYHKLQSKKKKIFIKSLLFSFLLLGINTYAWFVFIDKFDGNVSANVISWDVTFYDEDTSTDQVSLVISDLVPGMPDYEKQIKVSNNSDVKAKFTYEIVSFELLGTNYVVGEDLTNEQAIDYLVNYYPFSIEFNKTKDVLGASGDYSDFYITVKWPYEAVDEYFKLNNTMNYLTNVDYYILKNNVYTIDNTVNESNYLDKVGNGLYIESDEADTYWGKLSALYKENHASDSSLKIILNLIVTQQA